MAVSTTSGLSLSSDSIDGLRRQISGSVLLPGDGGYDEARTVWNGMIDRSPTLIVQPATTDDVVAAVNFAADQELPIAVRGGGHNAAGLAVCDDGLMIDLSRMKKIEVDPGKRTARAEGGATWAEFDAATAAHGLATTGGAVSTTGIGGLTLGGGLGNLMRSYGLASDNLISADVVTAAGTVVHASASENPELYWGLRGGGGNFGVVTSFEYRLHPVSDVLGGMLLYPLDFGVDFLRLWRSVTRSAPDAFGSFAGLLHAPDGTPMCGVVIVYNGPAEDGERVIQPLRDFGPPAVDTVAVLPYTVSQTFFDEAFPKGQSNYWRSHFLRDLSDEVIATIVERYRRVPSPLGLIGIEHLGAAVARIGRNETAFNHRDSDYDLMIIGRWTEPEQANTNIAWTRELSDAMGQHGAGVYVNYLGVGEQADRVRAAYGDEKYARLVELKNRYDPQNRFCFNQNIKPAR